MPPLAEIFLLALGSMLWPTLLFVDLVAFRAPRPVVILAGFLAGGLVTTVGTGMLIVSALRASDLVDRSSSTANATVYVTLGLLALVTGRLLAVRGRTAPQAEAVPGTPDRWSARLEHVLERGAPLAFVAGVVLNLAPGVLPFIGLAEIAALDSSPGATFAIVLAFYVVMFALVEVPAAGYAVAPQTTRARVTALNAWLGRNRRSLAVRALMVFGAFELVHGLVLAVT